MGALFGKAATKESTSQNVNNGLLTNSLGGATGYVGQAGDAIKGMLGIGGDPAAQAGAFNQFKNSTGFQSAMDAGTQAIGNSQAAKGMFQSGATGKKLASFGQGLGQQYLGSYMDKLFNLGQMGIGAGGILAQSGQTSQASEQGGKKGLLGSIVGKVL